ncbi:AAA family ATPase [Pedobacter sp. BS3]|uniref:ATP-dependent DNA helicase n=1 Tax=Pedobacter sp. BS3 TaxID=2567937 RepID=UPI0011F03ED0|nr:AAA family ATPase [Pedobacter sp. BS3]TZF83771.1 AAA family ATPase [Pedobacter sp. BS3]
MQVAALLHKQFNHIPTKQQEEVFLRFEQFIQADNGDDCFLLKGYAGTGKTTLISNLVKTLPVLRLKAVLLAPTGRAAKVISNYSGRKAFTIHKKIYRKKSAMDPASAFMLAPNMAENTLFIVDEASMISNEHADFSRFGLLHDLVSYVYNGKNCKLMLVGDTAQLPPVGSKRSPALDQELLSSTFGLTLFSYELTDVVRQQKSSGILYNATRIRELIRKEKQILPRFTVKSYRDIYRMNGERLAEGLQYAYDKYGMENTLLICRSNKGANSYNQQIRNRILYREEELTGGDYVMIVRNNYYWKQNEEANTFIANGDIARIRRVRNIHEMYGFRFADVVLEFVDYPDEEPLSCKILIDTLYSDTPSLSGEDSKRLYETVMLDYEHIGNKHQRMLELKTNPYYNALQVKFAYAVTCHKAQGGQWNAVFVDQGFLTEDMIDTEFLRWLYTAVTRATTELFLVNFGDAFFEQAGIE